MTTNEQDARALAYLAARIRNETYGANKWDEPGIWVECKALIGQHLITAIERVTRHAADPDAKTPGAIRRPFLPQTTAHTPKQHPPKRDAECEHHPGQWATSCGGCASDRATSTPAPTHRQPTDPPAAWHAARAELREADTP